MFCSAADDHAELLPNIIYQCDYFCVCVKRLLLLTNHHHVLLLVILTTRFLNCQYLLICTTTGGAARRGLETRGIWAGEYYGQSCHQELYKLWIF
jgi:hypothetical protein